MGFVFLNEAHKIFKRFDIENRKAKALIDRTIIRRERKLT